MADIDFDEYGGIPRFSADQAKRLVNLAGAACSVALMVGLGVWGYNLAVRDVTGVPVIKATQGAMRVAPEDPGGNIADHQGLAVNAIPELRPSDTLPEEIILAPAPVSLAPEDVAGLQRAGGAFVPVSTSAAARAIPLEAQIAQEAEAMAEAPVLDTEDAVALALAEALGQDIPADGDTGMLADDPATDLALSNDGDVVMRSPRPMARPQREALTQVASLSAAPIPRLVEIDPATLAPGTRLVQLGAYDSADQARGEWVRLTQRFGDLMSGKSVVLQVAESGGRTFYRLRANGFEGEDDARRFCSALLAEDTACIPVAHR